jgi:acyl carrier protein
MNRHNKIRELLEGVTGKTVEAAPDENLFDAGVLDSFALTDLVASLEKEFNILIPDGDLNPRKFGSIESINEYLDTRLD